MDRVHTFSRPVGLLDGGGGEGGGGQKCAEGELRDDWRNGATEDSLQLLHLPDSLLLEVCMALPLTSVVALATTCSRLYSISRDDQLWKTIFQRDFKSPRGVPLHPRACSWRGEYRRLLDESPAVLCEEVLQHRDQALHISFSHNGRMFATSSKDATIKVWNAGTPCSLLFEADMKAGFKWRYTQYCQFNKSDTLLLISGVHEGDNTTTGEIAVFDLTQDFKFMSRVLNKPYDVFGAWYDDNHLLLGTLRWIGHLESISAIWLAMATRDGESNRQYAMMNPYRFNNYNASSIRTIMVANVPTAIEDPTSPHDPRQQICKRCRNAVPRKTVDNALASDRSNDLRDSEDSARSDRQRLCDDSDNSDSHRVDIAEEEERGRVRCIVERVEAGESVVVEMEGGGESVMEREESCWRTNMSANQSTSSSSSSLSQLRSKTSRHSVKSSSSTDDDAGALSHSPAKKSACNLNVNAPPFFPPVSGSPSVADALIRVSGGAAVADLESPPHLNVDASIFCSPPAAEPLPPAGESCIPPAGAGGPESLPSAGLDGGDPDSAGMSERGADLWCRCDRSTFQEIPEPRPLLYVLETPASGDFDNGGDFDDQQGASVAAHPQQPAASSLPSPENPATMAAMAAAPTTATTSPSSPAATGGASPVGSASSPKFQHASDIPRMVSGARTSGRMIARCEKLLILTLGEETYSPHLVGIKRMTEAELQREEGAARGLDWPLEGDGLLPVSDREIGGSGRSTALDHTINMHGHIVGMALSPDQRYLYVNSRQWPHNYRIERVMEPPPIAQEIDIHVIDLQTCQEVGTIMRSHKAYTPNDECFFLFLDVSDLYVASGAEDKRGYMWDRHYGVHLRCFPHSDVVNSCAFNPNDPEMLVTVSDDNKIKIWRSRRQMREMAARGTHCVDQCSVRL